MKRVIYYLLIIILLSLWGIILTNNERTRNFVQGTLGVNRPCSEPVVYSIGTVDSQFGLSSDELRFLALEAEQIWESEVGKNLFQYDPQAEIKINLLYDERQQQTMESLKLENQLGKLESAHESVVNQYNNLSSQYNKELKDYNAQVSEYEKKLNEYNKDVEYWNKKGGAPEDEYEELEEERKDIKEMYADLEKQRKSVNELANKVNGLVGKENKIVNEYNANVNSYQNKYGESREFEKGVFDGKQINVYQFREKDDLRLTIAHEFGHALGINHLVDPQSLMYYLMSEQEMIQPKLSSEDISALKNVCFIK